MSLPAAGSLRLAIPGIILLLGLLPDAANAINCRVRLQPINFGLYIPLSPLPVDVIGNILIRCGGQPGNYAVTIGPGLSGNYLPRVLSAGGGQILNYNLYRDAARTQIWGNGTPPTFTVIGTRPSRGRPTRTNYSIYGRIFANQAPNPGTYADDLLVTVLF
jgi:spore coat protein U-like protein